MASQPDGPAPEPQPDPEPGSWLRRVPLSAYMALGVAATILVTSFVVSEVTRGNRDAGGTATFASQPTASAGSGTAGGLLLLTPETSTSGPPSATPSTTPPTSPVTEATSAAAATAPYGPASGPGPATTPTVTADYGTDLALHRTLSCSSSADNHACALFTDGDASTYWEARVGASYPQWAQVDLGSTMQFSKIVLKLPPGVTASETLDVYATSSLNSLITVINGQTFTFDPSAGDTITLPVTPVAARYIQVNITGASGLPAAELSALQVYA